VVHRLGAALTEGVGQLANDTPSGPLHGPSAISFRSRFDLTRFFRPLIPCLRGCHLAIDNVLYHLEVDHHLFHGNESETETEEHPSNGQGRGLIEYSAAL